MHIIKIRYGNMQIPLRTPFKTALRTVELIDDVVISIETDTGHVGFGSAPPTVAITGESKESILAALRWHIEPLVMGKSISDITGLCSIIQNSCIGNSSAKAAAEIALYDLFAQQQGKPLYQVLGGSSALLHTNLTISANDVEIMLADCESAIQRGFKALKVKVGKESYLDIERLSKIYAYVDGRASLRIDANQGWTAEQTILVLQTLENAGMVFELIEQPVVASDIDGLKYIKQRVKTPVLADESAFTLLQVKKLVELDAVDLINIKLMKTAGLSQAIAIADYCAANAKQCMMGCMLEGAISATAAVHFAIAKRNVISKIDLDGPTLGAFNPIDSNVNFNDAIISVTDAPGLGISQLPTVNWFN
jgi:o-succinylbenzoate synthase